MAVVAQTIRMTMAKGSISQPIRPRARGFFVMAALSSRSTFKQPSFGLILDQKGPKADMPRMIEISQEFGFDAAHYLGNGAAENRRLHGHSFYAEISLRGQTDANEGFLRDFGEVNGALEAVREELDPGRLNEIEGLGEATLENLAKYIYT